MTYKSAFFILFILSWFPGFSQQHIIDSLRGTLKTQIDKKTEIKNTFRIGEEFSFIDMKDSARRYFKAAIVLAKSPQSDSLEVMYSYRMGMCLYNLQLPDSSIRAFESIKNSLHLIKSPLHQCYYHNILGSLYRRGGRYDDAVKELTLSEQLGRKYNDTYSISNSLFQLGALYGLHGHSSDEVLKYYQRSAEAAHAGGMYDLEASVLSNSIMIYNNARRYGKALETHRKVLAFSLPTHDSLLTSSTMFQMVVVHDSMHNYVRAQEALDSVLLFTHAAQRHEKSEGLFESRANLAWAAGKRKLAISYLDSSIAYARMHGMRMVVLQQLASKAQKLLQSGNPSGAYDAMQQHYMLKDSIYNQEREKTIQTLEIQYQTRLKDEENKALTRILYEEQVQKYWQAGLAAVLLFWFWFSRRQRLISAEQKRRLVERERDLEMLKVSAMQDKLSYKNNELASLTAYMVRRTELLEEVRSGILSNRKAADELNDLLGTIDDFIKTDSQWEEFKMHFESVHPDFFTKLHALAPDLSPNDLRFCAYLRLNLGTKQIAQLLQISERTVHNNRSLLRRKLNLAAEDSLNSFLLSI
ncbi:MAG: hypothetical protein V4543_16580 [Bacteroidota bacterium]